ncbi:hypothetical protein ACRALDRAFT_1079014 [Sodiomyces alcalophilus JCM 7366]|uniref:uncharacterized protein n=1 Tax=Sodiomyces alcalophilus JCM 7366 TaxID=591952 RepID=UPI0039B51BF4
MAVATALSRPLTRRRHTLTWHPFWMRSRAGPSHGQRRTQSSKANLETNGNNAQSQAQAQESRSPEAFPTEPKMQGEAIPVPNTIATIPLWQRLGPLTRAAESYGRSQRKRPYWTQFCTTLVIYLCADISAQNMGGEEYTPERTGRSLIIGALASIPSYRWFIFLSQNFNYGSRILSLAVKITVNQAFFTPLFNSYFFGMQALLAGESLGQVVERVRRTVPTSVINSCKLWPAVTAFSFTFIPMEYRSVFAGVIAVGWQTYLSFLNRRAEEAAAAEAEVAVDEGLVEVALPSTPLMSGEEAKMKA